MAGGTLWHRTQFAFSINDHYLFPQLRRRGYHAGRGLFRHPFSFDSLKS